MPRLMGILNATPDSFYPNSRFADLASAIRRGIEIYEEGADMIDIGGESTRPNATYVAVEEELNRVIPLIKALKAAVPLPLSIDTSKPVVAEAAINAGATFINDVTGFANSAMQNLAASSGLEICVMHMQGTPQTMQNHPVYPEGIMAHLLQWFKVRIDQLLKAGVKKEQIILDPGIGFGKTVADNLEIIQNLQVLKTIGFPILLGVSRKSFLAKILHKPTIDLLPGTLSVNTMALKAGVDILRGHDVKEHRDIINITNCLQKKYA